MIMLYILYNNVYTCMLVFFVRAACVAGANAECWANGCGPTVPVSKNAVGLSHLYIETIILPRQARDKHRESSTQNQYVLVGAQGNMPFEWPSKFKNTSAILPPSMQVRKRIIRIIFLRCEFTYFILKMPSFCQDRLGTNIGYREHSKPPRPTFQPSYSQYTHTKTK